VIRVDPRCTGRGRTVALVVVVVAALAWLAVGITALSLPDFARGNGALFVTAGVIEAVLPNRAIPSWLVTDFRRARGALTVAAGVGWLALSEIISRADHHVHTGTSLAYAGAALMAVGVLGETALGTWAQRRQLAGVRG
jgi:hypothetical protein